MKINRKEYPILDKLYEGKLGIIPIPFDDVESIESAQPAFTQFFKDFNSDFKSEINVVSKSFGDGLEKSLDKLNPLLVDLWSDDSSSFSIKGTYIIKHLVYFISLKMIKENKGRVTECTFYIFDKFGCPVAFWFNDPKAKQYMWMTSRVHQNVDSLKSDLSRLVWFIILLKMFKSYANVEKKFLEPFTKVKDVSCVYTNETKLNLTFLDCKWFTTLINSNEFSVRGHFRLQPKIVNKKWTKELIWISEFKKHGYTSHARKLSYHPKDTI